MRRLPLLVSFSIALASALPAQDRPAAALLQHFTVEDGVVPSKAVRDGEARYTIWLPKGHGDEANKDKTWPWVLWLSGFGGSNEFQNGGGPAVLDTLRGENAIPELAFVVYRAPGRRGRSVYMNGEAACDTEDLLVGDLPKFLQAKYRLASDRKGRAVIGLSAGGFGALKIALRHPEFFAAVAAHSAAILPADPAEVGGMNEQVVQRFVRGGLAEQLGDPIDPAKWAQHMPLALVAAKKPEELNGLQIYFDAGTDDDYGFCPPNEQLSKVMTANGHKHLFRRVEGGGHAFGSPAMKDNVAHSLRFVAAVFAGKDAVAELTPKPEVKPAAPADGTGR